LPDQDPPGIVEHLLGIFARSGSTRYSGTSAGDICQIKIHQVYSGTSAGDTCSRGILHAGIL
jgi:hypothetical protein